VNPIRVLLADDHALVRAGIRSLLQHNAEIQVVAEAGEGHEALRLIEKHKPNVVLMDIDMPGLNGLEATALVTKNFPKVRVIILSMHANEEYVLQSLRAGAKGYLLKGSRTVELELALSAVARGETYLSPAASKHVIGEFVQRASGGPTPADRLTPRQRQVLQLLTEGYTRKQIALKFQVSAKTVDTYRAQLMNQLDIHDIAGLVRYALSTGLVK
jgi:DNA-binding NarL/FixJ family response regulator